MEAGLCWQCRGASGGQCVCEGDWVFIRTKCLSGVTAASRRRAVGEARRAFWIRRDVVTAKKGWGLGFEGEGREEGEGESEDEERRPRDLCGQELLWENKKRWPVLRLSCAGTGTKEGTWYSPLARLAAGGWQLALSVAPSSTTGLAWSWSWSCLGPLRLCFHVTLVLGDYRGLPPRRVHFSG